jgi:uncharacterized domain HDIG
MKNAQWEKDRIFCRHNIEHFMDVARIAYIMVLEKGLPINKEIIYAAALLHDIGRYMQYEIGIPHEKASADISQEILRVCGFNDVEIKEITEAILNHRKYNGEPDTFGGILYRSDKLSRACYSCSSKALCNWNSEKKNLKIEY